MLTEPLPLPDHLLPRWCLKLLCSAPNPQWLWEGCAPHSLRPLHLLQHSQNTVPHFYPQSAQDKLSSGCDKHSNFEMCETGLQSRTKLKERALYL